MTFYDGSKKIHHWFPRVNRMTEDYTDYDDTPDTMIPMIYLILGIFRRKTTIRNIISIKEPGQRLSEISALIYALTHYFFKYSPRSRTILCPSKTI